MSDDTLPSEGYSFPKAAKRHRFVKALREVRKIHSAAMRQSVTHRVGGAYIYNRDGAEDYSVFYIMKLFNCPITDVPMAGGYLISDGVAEPSIHSVELRFLGESFS